MDNRSQDSATLVRIARNQRAVLLCILAQLGLMLVVFLLPLPGFVNTALSLGIGLASLWFSVALARAVYGIAGTVVCALFLVAPIFVVFLAPAVATDMSLVTLVTLAVINQRATKELRAAGLKVGLLGASPAQLAARATG